MKETYYLDATHANASKSIKQRIQSILSKAEEQDQNVVIISINNTNNNNANVVFARQKWLTTFQKADNIYFCGKLLSRFWGSATDFYIDPDNYGNFFIACCGDPFRPGWRGLVTEMSVEEITEQYERARNFRREIVLEVNYLG